MEEISPLPQSLTLPNLTNTREHQTMVRVTQHEVNNLTKNATEDFVVHFAHQTYFFLPRVDFVFLFAAALLGFSEVSCNLYHKEIHVLKYCHAKIK
jgi:hypothetical protein